MKLLFVVHRYGFPGGSEIYVQSMAEDASRRGHQVCVFAGQHKGDMNNVSVSNNSAILHHDWDLIIVHGGDVAVQDYVLANAAVIKSPILYLLILPSNSKLCLQALADCNWIGCSTEEDWEHCYANNVAHKAVSVRHGINWQTCLGNTGFKQKYGITGKMFLSCGGYWPNKAMHELATVFDIANVKDATLVTTGYDNRMNLMPMPTPNIMPLLLEDRSEMLSALHDADCLLMHSYSEGFGLVLLEAMLNQTPWIARNIAGAKLLKQYGQTYSTDGELIYRLRTFNREDFNIRAAYDHVCNNHMIWNTVDDIERVAIESARNRY